MLAATASASLQGQSVQRHLQFRNRRSKFWMLSDLLLERPQNVLSALDMRFCSRIWLGIGFTVRFHDHLPPGLSLAILRIRGLKGENR